MDAGDLNERPLKKRRFFVDNESGPAHSPGKSTPAAPCFDTSVAPSTGAEENGAQHGQPNAAQEADLPSEYDDGGNDEIGEPLESRLPYDQEILNGSSLLNVQSHKEDEGHLTNPNQERLSEGENGSARSDDTSEFDADTFASIIGERLSPRSLRQIRQASGNDLERAVNIYFDGSWRCSGGATLNLAAAASRQSTLSAPRTPVEGIRSQASTLEQAPERNPAQKVQHHSLPQSPRYIGAFGVGAWATRSGTNLLRHGEHINVERTRSQPIAKRGRGGKLITNQKGDVLTRFTNDAGQEIGRLPRETAEWVSILLDQKICKFEGVCVFAPDRVRVNDTIYLQLRCYLRKEAFLPRSLWDMGDDNRSTTIFEEQENAEEKQLRLRQVALVKLFDEIGLQATSANEMTTKHKREGLLRAAEIAEQYDKVKKESKSSESSEEEASPELEEDQLDTLYKKAQSFDFNMPEAEPPPTFVLSLRKYQKQALHWMLAKERDNKSGRESSMHPLWEQYTWPLKDVDDQALPEFEGQAHFYVNPYSGELSVDFPAQEQHCLGGILADEMGLGKTIEMLSLIHSHRTVPPSQGGTNSSAELVRLPNSSTAFVPAPYTTLVVAPTSLLAQWESEAMKASEAGTMKVLMYYGADKSVNLQELCSVGNPSAPNIIITSYGVVLSEFRQLATQPLFGSNTQGGLFSVDFFRVILDEAHVIKNRRSKTARACYELKATHRWVLTGTPIVNRLEDLFSLVRFLKVEPWSNFSFWKTFITVPFESKGYLRALNVVQTVLEPLVLRRTKTMKTPEGEPLVPLPRRTINIVEVELSEQEREIYDLIYTKAKRTFNDNVEAGTLLKSFSTIFAQILRLRQTCCHPILTRNKTIVADEEDAATVADAANELKDDMDLQELIDRFTVSLENADSSEAHDPGAKFTTHALRQIQTESSGECPICSEEPMIDPAVTACWHSACKKCLEDYIRHQTDKGVPPRCFSCRAPVTPRDVFEVIRHQSPSSTPLEHDLYSSTPASSPQPTPRISLRRINPLSPSAHTSAKIHALVRHLRAIPPGTKSVVFSQFTSFLDLIGPQLTKAGISHVRLDGTMPQKARAEVLTQFNQTDTFTPDAMDVDNINDEDENEGSATPRAPSALHLRSPRAAKHARSPSSAPTNPSVLLISLRAGGVGLNLTAASNVFMMDPWWSFAIEAQAIDRVHRMGQVRDVAVTRFIVKDSIEGRMLQVQERKMNIAGSLGLRVGGDGSEDEKRKERIEELKMLFE